MVGHLCCTSLPLLMLDLVPVSVVNCYGRKGGGGRDRRRIGRRDDGGVVVRGEQEVIIAVVICINKGMMPIVGPSVVVPALKDGGTCLVIGLGIVLGEGDSEVCVAKWGDANQSSGEGWHDVTLASRWREVLELELSAGRGACNGAIGDANTDAGDRGVAVVNRGVLSEVDARGAGVSYSGVSDGKMGWVGGGDGLQDKETARANS
jgi:hypothetical protein